LGVLTGIAHDNDEKQTLTGIQHYRYIVYMKATIDIPDDLYRRVKAKSALRGQAVREVVMNLFQGWIAEEDDPAAAKPVVAEGRPAWFGAARTYAQRVSRHDMVAVRASIARGRTREHETDTAKDGQP
jgi:hypothetical protein